MIGPQGTQEAESFDIVVCTPDWLRSNMEGAILSGRNYLFLKQYDYEVVARYLREFSSSCQGRTWHEVAEKVSRVGKWEFEDYVPTDGETPT
jgi:hypothetical protein